MRKKIVTIAIISLIVIIGIRACYLKDYVTVLNFPEDSSKIFVSSDSITIAPYFYVKDFNTLGAVINFESLNDSLLLEDLDVTVYSTDNPDQVIKLRYVQAVVHPVSPGAYLDKLEVDSFNDLSHHDKTITSGGLPYNAIIFFFKTWHIKSTRFYNFKISGKLLYKGQAFDFEKDIKTERATEYQPYRMMT